jgi:hypothetical protein
MTGLAYRIREVRVSVLRNRIIGQHACIGPQGSHPAGTDMTPMVMPLALVDYGPVTSTYQDMHPQGATGDVNAVPLAVVMPGTFGKVVRAGHP